MGCRRLGVIGLVAALVLIAVLVCVGLWFWDHYAARTEQVKAGSPSWSHDGRLVVFGSEKVIRTSYGFPGPPDIDYRATIVAIPATAGKVRVIAAGRSPQCSPAAPRVAYIAQAKQPPADFRELWVCGLDGRGARYLCRGTRVHSWSPSGKWILFTDKGWQVVSASGGSPIRLATLLAGAAGRAEEPWIADRPAWGDDDALWTRIGFGRSPAEPWRITLDPPKASRTTEEAWQRVEQLHEAARQASRMVRARNWSAGALSPDGSTIAAIQVITRVTSRTRKPGAYLYIVTTHKRIMRKRLLWSELNCED